MAQWSSGVAASLDRSGWIGLGPCRCSSPPLPPLFRAAAPRRRRATRNACRIVGCASVPRELGTAAEAERPPPPPVVAEEEEEEAVAACEECEGMGWMLCDFCKGKKNNVKSEGTRVYRRCPTCKAAGFMLCPRCRVYKCITFPETNES